MSAVMVPVIDVANPPEGRRIELSVIASELGLSVRDMADACGLSRSVMGRILMDNVWPARADREPLRERLRALCAERGASEADLQILFHAHVHTRRNTTTNPEGRTRIVPQRPPRPQEITDVLLAKQTLSPEARRKWTLPVNPFDGEVESAEQMFTSGEIRFVREACWQAAVNARFVGVVGESGSGKTTLLADLKERIVADRKQVIVIEPFSVVGMEDSQRHGMPMKSNDILFAIVATLDPLARVGQTIERRARQAEKLLAGSAGAGNSHLLLIEEAHSLSIATLKHLKRLHERMRLNGRKPMLGILLLGQPELKAKLDEKRHDVREVSQRIELVELQPLGNDLKPYLQHRAKVAGRELAELIDDSGIEALRERLTVVPPGLRNAQPMSLLYPLAVNNLMTAVLNKTAQLGPPHATRDVVRLV